jgi:hypothetical protein
LLVVERGQNAVGHAPPRHHAFGGDLIGDGRSGVGHRDCALCRQIFVYATCSVKSFLQGPWTAAVPAPVIENWASQCRLLADIVAKVFCPSERVTLIQVFTRTRNIDSKVRTPDSIVSNLNSTAAPRRLLQQYRHLRDIPRSRMDFRFRWKSGHAADITAMTDFDPKPT